MLLKCKLGNYGHFCCRNMKDHLAVFMLQVLRCTRNSKAPSTRYSLLYNRFDNRAERTTRSTRLSNRLSNPFDNRLGVYTIQPVVKPVV